MYRFINQRRVMNDIARFIRSPRRTIVGIAPFDAALSVDVAPPLPDWHERETGNRIKKVSCFFGTKLLAYFSAIPSIISTGSSGWTPTFLFFSWFTAIWVILMIRLLSYSCSCSSLSSHRIVKKKYCLFFRYTVGFFWLFSSATLLTDRGWAPRRDARALRCTLVVAGGPVTVLLLIDARFDRKLLPGRVGVSDVNGTSIRLYGVPVQRTWSAITACEYVHRLYI